MKTAVKHSKKPDLTVTVRRPSGKVVASKKAESAYAAKRLARHLAEQYDETHVVEVV